MFDQFERARRAADRLLGLSISLPTRAMPQAASGAELWASIETLMRDIARLDSLDPVLTEVVRLHGARFHGCRLCQSRRSVRALDAAGVSGSEFARDLDPVPLLAVEIVDTIITGASDATGDLGARANAIFTDAQLAELIFDVMRNAANKIAVALGADAPNVSAGIEYFDFDASGEVVADTDAEAVRRATA